MPAVLRRVALVSVAALTAGVMGTAPAQAADECGAPVAPNNNNPSNSAPVPVADTASVLGGTTVTIRAAANDTDPDGDRLTAVSLGRVSRGDACLTPEGAVLYQSEASQTGYTVSFGYGVTDGDRYRNGTVTVRVAPLKAIGVRVTKRLKPRKKKPAQVAFTNPNSQRVLLVAGNPRGRKGPAVQRYLGPGQTFVWKTRLRRAVFITALESETSETLINLGTINTRKGRVFSEYDGTTFSYGFETGRSARAAALWDRR